MACVRRAGRNVSTCPILRPFFPTPQAAMKLIGSRTSPFVRKIRVILAERRIACEFVEESAWTADTTVPRYNPLNKVPALELDEGESIFDSRVIAEYLDAISGGGLVPQDPL